MPEKPELKIPEDYKAPLDKEITWRLDQLPEKIREKEIDIIEDNKQGLEQNRILKERRDAFLNLMRIEKKYVEGSQQFVQVHTNRMLIDRKAIDAKKKKLELDEEVMMGKVELNYLLNKFKGSQAIAQRKIALEK